LLGRDNINHKERAVSITASVEDCSVDEGGLIARKSEDRIWEDQI